MQQQTPRLPPESSTYDEGKPYDYLHDLLEEIGRLWKAGEITGVAFQSSNQASEQPRLHFLETIETLKSFKEYARLAYGSYSRYHLFNAETGTSVQEHQDQRVPRFASVICLGPDEKLSD